MTAQSADSGHWPIPLVGITESVVTTLGPNNKWNVAALGLHTEPGEPVTATTWGRTRTWRNFTEERPATIQFISDPRIFVAAALSVIEIDASTVANAHAWVDIEIRSVADGQRGGTQWEEWEITPVDATVSDPTVPIINRANNAVIEATVAASRLDVDVYDTDVLVDRLVHHAEVTDRCGGPHAREAFAGVDELTGWRSYLDDDTAAPTFDLTYDRNELF